MRIPRYEVYRSKEDAQFRYRLVGANGEPMCASEAYSSRKDARRGARAARLASLAARVVDE